MADEEISGAGPSGSALFFRRGFGSLEDLCWFVGECRPRRLRSMGEFAEAEIVIPDGPWKGFRFACWRQPYSGLFFRAVDRGRAAAGNGEGRMVKGEGSGAVDSVDSVDRVDVVDVVDGEDSPRRMDSVDGEDGVPPSAGPVMRASRGGRTGMSAILPWRRIIAVGPTQSGKTLTCFVIPIMYHLFEVGETVICVVPDLDMADDKWRMDIKPVIAASRYRDLLPKRGEGSRGGRVRSAVVFGNGVTLKFMTAGGGDTNRAAFTARVAAVTELNKFGERKASSDEADMWRQIQGRLRAYGDRGVIYGECTVTTEAGLVWQEYRQGTQSRIATPCRHCGEYVTLGREDLVGWEDAESVAGAERLARWCCSSCGVLWEEGDRVWSVGRGVLVHQGQEVKRVDDVDGVDMVDGENGAASRPGLPPSAGAGGPPALHIVGEPRETFSFSFRWSAVDNLFLSTGYIGSGAWTAKHVAEDEDNAEREQLQFVWALPVPDATERSITLRSDMLCHRQGRFGRGVVPPGTGLVAFLDLGKWRCHWAVVAGAPGAGPSARETVPRGGTVLHSWRYWVVDAGVISTEVGHLGEREGLLVAMREFAERMDQGFLGVDSRPSGDAGGPPALHKADGPPALHKAEEVWSPGLCLVDSGHWGDVVFDFMQERAAAGDGGWFPWKGHGVSQDQGRVYSEPSRLNDRVLVVGDRYHLAQQEAKGVVLVHGDVDFWKSRVHSGLSVDPGGAGSLVLWREDWRVHMPVARSLVSEVGVEEFVPEKGMVVKWVKKHKENHWFDCVVGCFVGLDYLALLSGVEGVDGVDGGQSRPGGTDQTGMSDSRGGRVLEEVGFGGALERG